MDGIRPLYAVISPCRERAEARTSSRKMLWLSHGSDHDMASGRLCLLDTRRKDLAFKCLRASNLEIKTNALRTRQESNRCATTRSPSDE